MRYKEFTYNKMLISGAMLPPFIRLFPDRRVRLFINGLTEEKSLQIEKLLDKWFTNVCRVKENILESDCNAKDDRCDDCQAN